MEVNGVKYSGKGSTCAAGGGGVHICVIPFPACGHILPLMDLTHQLLLRGLKVTIMVTPKNLCYLNPLLLLHSPNVQPLVFPFPSHPSLPRDVEQMQDLPISFLPHIVEALGKLQQPLHQWFRAKRSGKSPPVAIFSDILLAPWTVNLAMDLDIPNICFVPFNVAAVYFWLGKPSFLLPFYREAFGASMESKGFVFNSFKDLEGQKMGLVEKKFVRHGRVWGVGPLPPVNERGAITSTSTRPNEVLAWLDSCEVDDSVVFIGFGTQITLTKHQMKAVAAALEESGVRFIWSVKEPMKRAEDGDDDQSMIPQGFEDRVKGKGLVIKGWVPQVTILKHRAVGSYLTHCGWNSALEAIVAGVLLLAWPMQADHFQITSLLADEVGAAIRVCKGLRTVPDATELARILVKSTTVKQTQRVRAMELQKTALAAIKEGGSSYQALDELVEQFSGFGIDCGKTDKMNILRSSM
ncbi:UDP-Glycosyltransferase superfamily protein [Hibiscus syriacus]|uniref:UDP-Glycosyltransferase superfamily protein n=1 Tax=Hibiscus syriacus TaxID=106335 RepID=A0A6A3C5X7_HIBSY|nr:flavonol 7-O-rhamnosyltransferase-like [Hibiscus syriacus]KAE8722582.1 UDP-Glycosyltransferase superfamily protein [Hibiscus syriacus]